MLSWNADPTRLPAGLHLDFLDMFASNSLANGESQRARHPGRPGPGQCDTFVVGARTDHLTEWKACYATTQLLGGASQFALSTSGHIQSLVNPPGNPKMSVSLGPRGRTRSRGLAGRGRDPARLVVGAVGPLGCRALRVTSGRPPAAWAADAHPVQYPAPGRYVVAP